MSSFPASRAEFTIVRKDVVASTNDEARMLADDGAADRTVVCANVQTAGRGRRGRRWESPAGNLYLSVLLRPARPAREAAQLSLVATLGLGDALAAFVDASRVRHKWPNDVLIDNRKVAGLLLESSGAGTRPVDWVIIGCGVNVATHPEAAAYPVSDLNAAAGTPVSPDAVLERFLDAFDGWYRRWLESGIGVVRDAWLARAQGLGKEILVRLPDRELRGVFQDMDASGALILALPDGKHEVITAGDVFA